MLLRYIFLSVKMEFSLNLGLVYIKLFSVSFAGVLDHKNAGDTSNLGSFYGTTPGYASAIPQYVVGFGFSNMLFKKRY